MGKLIKGSIWKRQLGVTKTKQKIANITGRPTTKSGLKRRRNSLIARLSGLK
ncbi:MAG: hypothetical protein RBR71_07325 [Gudongella sp.]|nr:hypothetical protein [Gudongella sp.]